MIAEGIARDGFVVVPRALDAARVRTLRRVLGEARARATKAGGGRVLFDPGASIPEVQSVLTDASTMAVARSIVGDPVLELHQSAVHFGAVNRGWHKDNADYMRGHAHGPDDSADYHLVHFAWYLQDHDARFGGGISFRRGSHHIPNDRDGEVVTPDVAAGDLVIFDLRMTHFGNTLQLRWPRHRPLFVDRVWRLPQPWAKLAPWKVAERATRALPWLFVPEHGADRMVVFAIYGANDAHTQRFFDWMCTQPDLEHVRRHGKPTPLT